MRRTKVTNDGGTVPRLLLMLGLIIPLWPAALPAQGLDTLPADAAWHSSRTPQTIRWWHGALAAGGLSALMLLDHPAQRFASHNSGNGADGAAGLVRHFGQPEVYGTVTVGLLAAGLVAHEPRLVRAGGRLATSLAVAGLTTQVGKYAFGRPRPEQSLDADGYIPFSGQVSMPSGHTAMAFALATSLADDIHRPWATVGLYGMATAVGWSRVNDNRHWLSDVAAGALLGITSAKLSSGRWRIFGLKPPSILSVPSGAAVGWSGQF
ncbi:MAG TPA: phosphatase PAP2 family protein [Gemmatimonadales bacterium]|nr:phosphatase PAP2 family protein [Gemmatimonadales bacterium]